MDDLVEHAAETLGEPKASVALTRAEAARPLPHKPPVKLHECFRRDMRQTLWSSRQLQAAPFEDRLREFTEWLPGVLLERDSVFVGLWRRRLAPVLERSPLLISMNVDGIQPACQPIKSGRRGFSRCQQRRPIRLSLGQYCPYHASKFDYAGPTRDSRYRTCHIAFHQVKSVGALIASFRSSIPSPPVPLFTLRRAPHGAQRKTRGRAVRYSFVVGLFHSLLHAGLPRRTDSATTHSSSRSLAKRQ